jgi:CubicO group peptidase (beta-lactamase class C family)
MRKKILFVSSGILISGIITWFLLPHYIQGALLYLKPGILDYKIFDNRTVETGHSHPWPIDERYNSVKLSEQAVSEFEKYETVVFLVARDGKILHEEYWDGWNDTTISNSFSMAKSIVSLLIGCLVDEGKITVEDPVHKYIPELDDMKDHPILIRHLLNMSSGLDWDESYSRLTSVTTQAYYGNDIQELVTSLKPAEEPGKIYRYKSCDSQLLGIIVARVSGMKISEYASLKLWQPLGAESPALWSLDRNNGNEKTYCCFNATARDFARIGQMVLDSGMYNDRQVVSKEYILQATSPATWLRDEFDSTCNYYGYQFWLTDYQGVKVEYARGILGQYIFIIPALNTVIVRLGHRRSSEYRNYIPVDAFVFLDEGIRLAKSQ